MTPLDPAPEIELGALRLIVCSARENAHGLKAHVQAWDGEELVHSDTVMLDRADARKKYSVAVNRAAPSAEQTELDDALPKMSFGVRAHLRESTSLLAESTEGPQGNAGFRYFETDIGLGWLKPAPNGYAPTRLTNFTASIVSETAHDDGADVRRVFEIEVKLNGRVRRLTVTAKEFAAMDWPMQLLGAMAIVFPGYNIREHARTAIQHFSGNVSSRTVYGHTGWRKIDGRPFYLHAGGAIGKDGLTADVAVELGSERMKSFALPHPPTNEDLKEAFRSSLCLRHLVPPQIGYPLLASAYRAPLGVFVTIDFSISIVGPTGVGKTEVAAMMQAHFGAAFNSRNLPGNWASTANSLEKKAFLAKDSLLVVDDFAPAGSSFDVAHLHKDADRLLRGQGNRSGRGRMNNQGELRCEYLPRGLIVATGEDVPRGESLRGRMLVFEVPPGGVDFKRLGAVQSDAAAGRFASVMAAYIQWIARNFDVLQEELPARQHQLRLDALAHKFSHARTPDIVASLALGWESFLRFLVDNELIPSAERDRLWIEGWEAITAAGAAQSAYAQAEDPVEGFLALVRAALASGQAHVVDPHGREPESPGAWGWSSQYGSKTQWCPQGYKIGWLSGVDLYLEATATYSVAQTLARASSGSTLPTLETLKKRLDERGLLRGVDVRGGRRRLGVRKTLEGKRRPVLHLTAADVLPPDPDDEDDTDAYRVNDEDELSSTKADFESSAAGSLVGPDGPLGPRIGGHDGGTRKQNDIPGRRA